MDAEVASGRRPTKAPTLGLSCGSWVPPTRWLPTSTTCLARSLIGPREDHLEGLQIQHVCVSNSPYTYALSLLDHLNVQATPEVPPPPEASKTPSRSALQTQ